jgi:hypothetical protein
MYRRLASNRTPCLAGICDSMVHHSQLESTVHNGRKGCGPALGDGLVLAQHALEAAVLLGRHILVQLVQQLLLGVDDLPASNSNLP